MQREIRKYAKPCLYCNIFWQAETNVYFDYGVRERNISDSRMSEKPSKILYQTIKWEFSSRYSSGSMLRTFALEV